MQLIYKHNFIGNRVIKTLIFLILIALFLKTLSVYEGNKLYYVIFSITFNFSIYRILFKKFYFFEFFFSSLLWLGFWFKFSIFESGIYSSKEIFDGRALCGLNIQNFDNILFISSIGYLGYILSLITVDNFNFLNNKKVIFQKIQKKKNFLFSIFFIFLIFLILSTVTNYIFGIYQKGILPNENFLFLSNIIYPFFYNIGFGAALCYFIKNLHIYNIKYFYIIILIIIVEGFLTNVSMLSRNMILYSTQYFGYVFFIYYLDQFKLFKKKLFFSYLFMVIIFFISIISTNNLRDIKFIEINPTKIENKEFKCKLKFKKDNIQNIEIINLALSRSIGIEGMIATINNKQILGFGLLKKL